MTVLPNGWKKVKLGDVVKMSSGGTPSKDNVSFWNGDIPWISALEMHKNFVEDAKLNITEEALKKGSSLAKKKDLLLLTRGSMLWKRIPVCLCLRDVAFNQDVKCLHTDNKLNSTFLLYWFGCMESKIMHMVVGTGIGAGKLESSGILDLDVDLPPIEEQKKIVATLSVWDSAIEKMEKLIEVLEERYQAYVNEFFFENQSERKKLKMGDVFAVRNDRSVATEDMPLYSLTIENGITAKTDRYDRGALVKDKDSKKYKIVCDGDVVYNPANLRWGAIGQSKVGHNVVVSPIYEVLYTRDNSNDSRYLSHYIMSKKMIAFYSSKTEGTLIERKEVKIDQFLRIDLYVERDPARQKMIADVLDMHQEEISNLKQQLENYKKQKQGLMQKLLTGQWRVK